MKEMKLSQYAKLKNRCYRTMWNKFHDGLLPNAYADSKGSIYIRLEEEKKIEYVAIYARVSSNDQKNDLTRQIERLSDFTIKNGYSVNKIYKEIASGMNDNRKILNKILTNQDNKVIIIENKDRLTRFGFNYIKNLLELQDRFIEVMNETSSQDEDLMKDLISIITSFCCRLYGMRRGLNKSKEIKENLK